MMLNTAPAAIAQPQTPHEPQIPWEALFSLWAVLYETLRLPTRTSPEFLKAVKRE